MRKASSFLLSTHVAIRLGPVVEDNAGPYASYYNVTLWELLKVARIEWPSNSPDLNAIEPT